MIIGLYQMTGLTFIFMDARPALGNMALQARVVFTIVYCKCIVEYNS